MIYEVTYEHLSELLEPRLGARESDYVRRAYETAERAHAGQSRDEGFPYIVHPLRVAISLADELGIYSPEMISAALLHDVIEDSDATRGQIAAAFGEQAALLVWLLTKREEVSLPDYLAAIEEAAETGAPIVKLCDHLDNLRFVTHSPMLEKKLRYVRTTEMYYLPMAERTNPYLYEELSRSLEAARLHVTALA